MQVRSKRQQRVVLDTTRFYREVGKRGWVTRSEMADNLGLPESVLSKLLSGKNEPSGLTIDRLLTELEVPYTALFHREEVQS